ncbi:MAG: tetratricopeptide repeat protein, partial [Holophagales bacterium]|nr:tetratricopeptide repeat protein [Holophagales bacterium]
LEALEMLRGAWGDSHRDVLGTRTELAFVRHLLGEAALEEQEEILAAKIEHQGADSGSVAYSLTLLARQYEDHGRQEAAEGALRRALEIRRSRLGDEHPKTASGLHALGAFLLRTGELDEAAEMLGKATPLLREALPPRHPTLGEALLDLAELRYRQARPREAEPPAREGAALLEARLPEGHPLRERAGRLLAELEEGGDPVRQLETSSPDRRGGAAGSAG